MNKKQLKYEQIIKDVKLKWEYHKGGLTTKLYYLCRALVDDETKIWERLPTLGEDDEEKIIFRIKYRSCEIEIIEDFRDAIGNYILTIDGIEIRRTPDDDLDDIEAANINILNYPYDDIRFLKMRGIVKDVRELFNILETRHDESKEELKRVEQMKQSQQLERMHEILSADEWTERGYTCD